MPKVSSHNCQGCMAATKNVPKKKPEWIPLGWSMREQGQKAGQQPRCRGCNKKLTAADKRLRHKFKEHKHHVHHDIHQHHCQVACLKQVPKAGMRQLLAKKWDDPECAEAVKELKKKMKK